MRAAARADGQGHPGKNLKAYGEPHTEFCTTTDALKTAVGAEMFAMDALDWFDGASDIIPALQVGETHSSQRE